MATRLGTSSASDLFEVEFLDDAPQVHLHFLSDDREYLKRGYGKLELCCHGCGDALIVFYSDKTRPGTNIALRDGFTDLHRRCPNKSNGERCLDYRHSVDIIDVRKPLELRVDHLRRSLPRRKAGRRASVR